MTGRPHLRPVCRTLTLSVGLQSLIALNPSLAQSVPAVCSEASLTRVEGAFNSRNLPQARAYAEALLNCPEHFRNEAERWLARIAAREENGRRKLRATIAFQQENLSEACRLLLEIRSTEPDYPGLGSDLARIPSCSEERRRLEAHFDEALDLRRRNRHSQALRILRSIQQTDPDFPGIADQIAGVEELLRAEQAAQQRREEAQIERQYGQAKAHIEAGELGEAKELLSGITQLRPDYRDARDLLAEVERRIWSPAGELHAAETPSPPLEPPDGARESVAPMPPAEREALRSALTEFYSGRYDEASRMLRRLIEESRYGKVRAIAYFYLASSQAAAYFASGERDSALSQEATQLFQTVRAEFVDFRPIWKGISPRIRALYEAPEKTGTEQ